MIVCITSSLGRYRASSKTSNSSNVTILRANAKPRISVISSRCERRGHAGYEHWEGIRGGVVRMDGRLYGAGLTGSAMLRGSCLHKPDPGQLEEEHSVEKGNEEDLCTRSDSAHACHLSL